MLLRVYLGYCLPERQLKVIFLGMLVFIIIIITRGTVDKQTSKDN